MLQVDQCRESFVGQPGGGQVEKLEVLEPGQMTGTGTQQGGGGEIESLELLQ